tara:strand:- start:118 stop:654 length:537 start_codon:yes stop_codon:yes gene_type:complete
MIQKISKITFLVFVLSIFQNSLLAIESGNDGVGSIIPKTSIAKPPTKLTAYKSAKKKIIKAKKYDKKGKDNKAIKLYEEALNYLYEANRIKPFDPDILSYLGLVNAKIGNLDDAEIYYLLGLEIDPKHNGINEYLGKFYITTNRLGLAKERLEILKNCNCDEYSELKDFINTKKVSLN